jgi:hypothetical protein
VTVRLEAKAALLLGILLPTLETCRRGMSEWGVDFTTMFTDYLAGALLLIGAWAACRDRPWANSWLLVAWGWVTGMMVMSLADQLEGTIRDTDTEPFNALVLVVKFILLSISLLGLISSFRRGPLKRDA